MNIYCLSFAATAATAFLAYRCILPRVDEDLAKEVIFGNHDPSVPIIFAHRGGIRDAPENTVAAIVEAKRRNVGGVEFDVAFTKDSIGVLFHDDTVDRTTDGRGRLAELTFNEVRTLDASKHHPLHDNFKGERVPTVEEAVQKCLKLGLRIIFDVKSNDYRSVVLLEDLFKRYAELQRMAMVASFYPNIIYRLRCRNRRIVTALIWRPRYMAYDDMEFLKPRYGWGLKHLLARAADVLIEWSFHTWLWYFVGVSAVLIVKDCVCQEYIRRWQCRNIPVMVWTPNLRMEKLYLTKVLKLPIITDSPVL